MKWTWHQGHTWKTSWVYSLPVRDFFPRFSFFTPLQGQAPQAVFWVYPCVYFYMIYNTKTDSGMKYLQIFYPETWLLHKLLEPFDIRVWYVCLESISILVGFEIGMKAIHPKGPFTPKMINYSDNYISILTKAC